jgi:hypothetical protein
MIEMSSLSRSAGYTVFKKGLIKLIKSALIAFEVFWGIVGWTCLVIFACYVYVVGKLVEGITLSEEK